MSCRDTSVTGALREELRRHDLARRIQQTIATLVATAWDLATGQDIHYPGAVGKQPGPRPSTPTLCRAERETVAGPAQHRQPGPSAGGVPRAGRPVTALSAPSGILDLPAPDNGGDPMPKDEHLTKAKNYVAAAEELTADRR
ncbi:hypothetical protein [Streptomyces mobaraensis]|uniref:Uncharacterized protein n=1 Tax=Streptomyces mobaraensis TaxID=35621 RepID=A0A5N5W194_STRMB|nr:hypothetical protein [Streptomyces mobaraensis]KAB7835569.1 hypothetical protein FRZ00_27175 [Streptomyces mobaraensis]